MFFFSFFFWSKKLYYIVITLNSTKYIIATTSKYITTASQGYVAGLRAGAGLAMNSMKPEKKPRKPVSLVIADTKGAKKHF